MIKKDLETKIIHIYNYIYYMPPKRKEPLTEDILNKFVQILFKVDTITDACAISFSKNTLTENKSIDEYHKTHMGDQLRECIYVKKCPKLVMNIAHDLKEQDLITILRYLLKQFGYKIITDENKKQHLRLYSICKA
jgi:isocitrate dehydrogenase kinase/phosphatase